MEESELVGHLCTPRYHNPTTTTTINNNNNNNNQNDHYHHSRKRSKRKRPKPLTRSKSQHDIVSEFHDHESGLNPELSVDTRAPGLLKIFGDSLVAGTQYKSVLASTRSTAQELIKQSLERYGIAPRLYKDFVLCEVVGRTVGRAGGGHTNYGEGEEGFDCQSGDNSGSTNRHSHKKSKDKRREVLNQTGTNTSQTKNNLPPSASSPSLILSSSSSANFVVDDSHRYNHRHHQTSSSKDFSLSSPRAQSNPNTPRSGHSNSIGVLRGKTLKKLFGGVGDLTPCGSPRVNNCDSPRTPLGSPRTPCGSPSTSRGSPRAPLATCPQNGVRSGHEDLDLLNYRPPKVLDSGSYGNHHHLQHRLISKSDRSRLVDSPRSVNTNTNNNLTPRQFYSHTIDKVPSPRQDGTASRQQNHHPTTTPNTLDHNRPDPTVGDWIPVYFRVLSSSDKPLELQAFWKPPEGLSRRYELKRRRDVVMDAMENETTGLNENARKIMMSKIVPGVIPVGDTRDKSPEARTVLRDEWNRAANALTNASLTYTDDNDVILTNSVEGDPRQAYICPSIYPYLLTLRGCSIQKDLVLYPLKSRSLAIGSAEKKPNSDDIKLTSHDVSQSHCRVTLKRLPQDENTSLADESSKRIYWYCLDLEIVGSSFVTVNGVQVRQKATVFPGDLLGIGRQYLFLYKDPTGGHDIPSAVPWLPENEMEASAIYSQVIRHHQNENREEYSRLSGQAQHPRGSHETTIHNLDIPAYQEEDSNILDDSAARETAIFLAYHRDREMELLECIAEVECHAKGDYPLSQAVLFLASHQYAARKFSGNRQATFFKRLVRVVRARVGVVSKLASQQKQESRIFNTDKSAKPISTSADVDYFPCLVNWLSTVMTLLGHCRTNHFQSYVSSLAKRNDVIKSVQEAVGYFEETVSFLFQQIVYSVTKVLYDPINQFIQSAFPAQDTPKTSPLTNQNLQRILNVLQAVRRLVSDLLVHPEVANQLMVYLLFFVSTTMFNRIIAKGSRLYNRESGSVLQGGVGALESWANEEGLEPEFVHVSEHILSLVDLLSSSKRTLLRLDFPSFQSQFSPLSDIQLSKVLSEYDVGPGVTAPPGWQPSHPVDPRQGDLTVSLSSHPPFVLPKQGEGISLQDSFPAGFYKHLELAQQRFSLVGEDAYHSGLSSAGNTPRLSDPTPRPSSSNQDTFFTSHDPNSSMSGTGSWSAGNLLQTNSHKPQVMRLQDPQHQHVGNNDNVDHHHRHQQHPTSSSSTSATKRIPPQTAPKPKRPQPAGPATDNNHDTSSLTNQNRASAPPPYNMAVKLKQSRTNDNTTNPSTTHHQHTNGATPQPQPRVSTRPLLQRQSSTTDQPPTSTDSYTNPKPKSNTHKFQTLPDNIKDKLFSHQNPTISNSRLHRNHSASSGKGGNKPVSTHRLQSQKSLPPPTTHHPHPSQTDLLATYPPPNNHRPRPSSATDFPQSPQPYQDASQDSSTSGPFMSHNQRSELLSTRSNSALGYDMANTTHNISHDAREHILHLSNYTHLKDATSVTTQHVAPYNYTPQTDTTRQQHINTNTPIDNVGLFSYGSLKRSPRNTNLSQRTSSNNKTHNPTNTDNQRPSLPSSPQNSFVSTDQDVPPPLPPRGDNIRRQTSRDSSRDRQQSHRESPLGSALSSSGHRPRAGSRTSVEIQDITENQYVIYNPDSPAKEIFDFNQNYQSMANKNHGNNSSNPNSKPNAHHPRSQTSDQPKPSRSSNPNNSLSDPTKKLTRVPPLELPDDLLGGVSENDSQEDVFNGGGSHFGSSSESLSHGRGRRVSSMDDYPDDVYIDVNDLSNSDSTTSSNLKVLPVSDRPSNRKTGNDMSNGHVFVRYRHSMPSSGHDVTTTNSQGQTIGEVFTVTLTKGVHNKLGMGLIDGLHTPLKLAGIYIRNVLPDTPAALCGCLRVGDRILSINDSTVIGVDYNSVMKIIQKAGPSLVLTVSKGDSLIASKISASTA